MTEQPTHEAPAREDLLERWFDLRDALDDHYGIASYPFAADRILNDARHRGLAGAPRSQLILHQWTTAENQGAIACCERHRSASPDTAPRTSAPRTAPLQPPNRRGRRSPPSIATPTPPTSRPEHVLAVAVHDILSADIPPADTVIEMLLHLLQEIEYHGNVPDPTTMPDPTPGAILEMPDFPAPWNHVPGRPREPAVRPDPAFPHPSEEDKEFYALLEQDEAYLADPDAQLRTRWHRFCGELAIHYRWYDYPTAEARILRAATGADARGLPDRFESAGWTADETEAALACCERYLQRHPDALPPFPPRRIRCYNSLATPSRIAAFATACEKLELNPEDALVLALHELCLADRPGTPEAMETLLMIVEDIEIHGNVLDPAIIPETPADVQ